MDSKQIAIELEKRYPEPSLHLDAPELAQLETLLPKAITPLRYVLIPNVPHALLSPESEEYFQRTRKETFGMPLAQVEKEKGGEDAWRAAEPAFKEVGELYRKNGGPFLLGKEVGHADFIVVGILEFGRKIDQAYFERMVTMEPTLKTLYDASKQWLERNDH